MGPQDELNRNVLAGELRDALVGLGYGGVMLTVPAGPVVVIELEKGDTGMLLMLVVDDPSREDENY